MTAQDQITIIDQIANNMIKVMEAVEGGADAKAKAAEAYALALNAFCDGDE